MPVRGFDHLAMTVEDVERTVAFYQDLLGAEVLDLDRFRDGSRSIVSLVIGANRISVHPSPPRVPLELMTRRPTPGAVDLCFRWDGPVEEILALVEDRGLPIVSGPVTRIAADGSLGTSVYLRDPDGNLLELLTTDGTPPETP